jgi:hypothetical protein
MDLDVEFEHNSNSEMASRASEHLGERSKSESLDTIDHFFDAEFDPDKSPDRKPMSILPPPLDLLDRMDKTYRLLDLIYEQGSGGAGKSVVIFTCKGTLSVLVSGKGHHSPRIRWTICKSHSAEVLHLHDQG